MSAIIGPIATYSNVPIASQNYNPSQFFISNIGLGIQTTITTTTSLNYVVGQLVRLVIPLLSGCRELNQQVGYVMSIPAANQVVLNLNSSKVSAFTITTNSQQPQILPVGDINNGIISSTGRSIPTTNIPGSFINVSP